MKHIEKIIAEKDKAESILLMNLEEMQTKAEVQNSKQLLKLIKDIRRQFAKYQKNMNNILDYELENNDNLIKEYKTIKEDNKQINNEYQEIKRQQIIFEDRLNTTIDNIKIKYGNNFDYGSIFQKYLN